MELFMKKTTKTFILSALLALPIMFGLTGCADHTHLYDTKWSADGVNHWHKCDVEGCKEISDVAEHTYGDWLVDEESTYTQEGSKHRKCSVCHEYQYETIPILSSEGLSFALNEDGESYSLIGLGTCSETIIAIPSMYEGKPVTEICREQGYNENIGRVERVIIPSSITHIRNEAFKNYTALKQISLPNSVTNVGTGAFDGCGSLKSVTLSSSIENIADNMFSNCISLESIVIPSNIKTIGEAAFLGSGLKSIVVPDSIETIGPNAFKSCESLSSVTLPSGLTTINENTFGYCSSLESITIPNSVTSVYFNAFLNCTALETVNVGESTQFIIPNSTYARSFNQFNGCIALQSFAVDAENPYYSVIDGSLYSKDGKILYVYAHGKAGTTFTVPSGVERIEDNAFLKSNNLVSVIVPDSVKYIGLDSFYGCNNLESITIGTGVEVIGRNAFKACEKFATINYTGTESQWNAIIKGKDQDFPENEYSMGTSVTPTFSSQDSGDDEN